jgi:hypothetical protein
MKVWIDRTKGCAAATTRRTPPDWFEISAKCSPHTAELERPHAARIGTDGQDLPRRRGLRHPRADRSRGVIRLGEGKDRGPGATRRDPPAAALRSLSAKRWP